MTKNIAIIGANGAIARIVEERLLDETDVHLILLLRKAKRLAYLDDNPRVTLIDGDANNYNALQKAIKESDVVYVSFVDNSQNAAMTKNIIEIMDKEKVSRLISSNILGIYDEVPGEFGDFNRKYCFGGKVERTNPLVIGDQAIENSDLNWTVMRIAWLNDRNNLNYTITQKGQEYVGVSVSRKSVADVVVDIVKDENKYSKESIGFADPATQGAKSPVY